MKGRGEAQQWLEGVLDAILDREGGDTGESTVIANHLAQMKSFGIRQGVELYPKQDSNRTRYKFIEKLYNENQIDLNLHHYWDLFLTKGRVCWYLKPTGDSYKIYHFGQANFRANHGPNGELQEVVIIYSYQDRPQGTITGPGLEGDRKYVRLLLTKEKVITEIHQTKPEFNSPFNSPIPVYAPSSGFQSFPGATNRTEAVNTLGWIPCVITGNYVSAIGSEGKGEFDFISNQLYKHHKMCEAIAENISFFGNPTLVTSRSVSEVKEDGESSRTTYSSASGFTNEVPGSSRLDPTDRNTAYKRARVAKIIGNVQADERFGYITPDPISPDQSRYVAEYRESLHAMLGGVDPQSISAGATAFEIKSLYGRSAATALNKAKALYKHGLCKVFEMAIEAEERIFKLSIAEALGKPIEELTDAYVQELISQPEIPKELKAWSMQGLPPLGDRQVLWRWLGPVFEDSPLDLQQKSIVVRNLEEVGVETSSALRFLFPEKTDSEIRSMLTGFPFREANQSAMALSQQISSYTTLMSTPGPDGQPLGLSLNNLSIIDSILNHILRRLNYGITNEPATPGSWTVPSTTSSTSTTDSAAAVLPAASTSVLPTGTGQLVPGSFGANSSAAAAGLALPATTAYSGDRTSGGITPADIYSSAPADFRLSIPAPGSTTALPQPVPGIPAIGNVGVGLSGIPSDLAQYPDILASVYGTNPSGLAPGPIDRKRGGVSKSSRDQKRSDRGK